MAHVPSKSTFLSSGLTPTTNTSSRQDGRCPICFNHLQSAVRTPCNHVYCSDCAETWFNSSETCPDCRRPLYQRQEPPPELPDGVESLNHNIVITDSVVREFYFEFGEMIDDGGGFDVPGQENVLVKYGDQLPSAVGAATWLKPNADEGYDFLCRDDWVNACGVIRRFLQDHQDGTMTANQMHTRLSQSLRNRLVQNGRWPVYWNNNTGREKTFEGDIQKLVDFVVMCAHDYRQVREDTADE